MATVGDIIVNPKGRYLESILIHTLPGPSRRKFSGVFGVSFSNSLVSHSLIPDSEASRSRVSTYSPCLPAGRCHISDYLFTICIVCVLCRRPMPTVPFTARNSDVKEEGEEEEEEAVFTRGSITKEDPPNHQTRTRRNTDPNHGSMSAQPRYMHNLQRCCGVHPHHHVDTCQGAVNIQCGAVPSGAV